MYRVGLRVVTKDPDELSWRSQERGMELPGKARGPHLDLP
jgi:hypothetical protein